MLYGGHTNIPLGGEMTHVRAQFMVFATCDVLILSACPIIHPEVPHV